MTQPTASAICDDIAARIRVGAPILGGNIVPAPPEGPPAGLTAWLDYGPVEMDWGLMEVSQPTITVTVATNRKGHYPGEYRTVTDAMQEVHWALRGSYVIATEAVIVDATISRAGGAQYAGIEIVAATMTLTIEMKQQNVAAGAA